MAGEIAALLSDCKLKTSLFSKRRRWCYITLNGEINPHCYSIVCVYSTDNVQKLLQLIGYNEFFSYSDRRLWIINNHKYDRTVNTTKFVFIYNIFRAAWAILGYEELYVWNTKIEIPTFVFFYSFLYFNYENNFIRPHLLV